MHDCEAFGPVSTLMPYDGAADAIALAKRGEGSLVGSLFTADDAFARDIVLGVAAHHGRLLVVEPRLRQGIDRPRLAAPRPGPWRPRPRRRRRGDWAASARVLHYLQRTALQGSPATLDRQ